MQIKSALVIGTRQAWRNILRTPVRSLLIIMSVTISLGLYVLLSEIGGSFHQQLLSIVKSGQIDVVVKSKFSATPLSSSITLKELARIRKDPLVKEVTSVLISKIRTRKGGVFYILGIKDFWQVAHKMNLTLLAGRPYGHKENEAVFAARILQVNRLKIGGLFPASKDIQLHIVGSFSTWISLLNNTIICSDDTLRAILDMPDKTNILFVGLKDPSRMTEFITRINQEFSDLIAIPSRDLNSQIGVLSSLTDLMNIISVIALIVAVTILTSTFVMAVYLRTRQIGILSAIGWPQWMIISLFVIESVMLAVFSGVLGIMMATGTLLYLRTFFPNVAFYLPDSLSLYVVVVSLFVSIIVGAFAAIVPAYYAVHKPIIKAIRDE